MAMASDKSGLVFDPVCKEHHPGREHPESPERLDAVLAGIAEAVPEERLVRLRPRAATDDELALCHTRAYIDRAKAEILSGQPWLSTGDTEVCERSLAAARHAAGGVLAAVDAVLAGTVRNAFCAVRPPGHHATPDRGMGFCVFNNVAIGARYAQRRGGIERVLIADWDVHHGNGTQAVFYEDPSVFYFSTHQWPLYPGTGQAREAGAGAGRGYTLNCPFPAGSGRTEIVGAFREQLIPAMRRFKPQFVFVSAGFDACETDPLAQFVLREADFAELTNVVMGIAAEHAAGRIVSALEGGYRLDRLAAAAGAHVLELTRGPKFARRIKAGAMTLVARPPLASAGDTPALPSFPPVPLDDRAGRVRVSRTSARRQSAAARRASPKVLRANSGGAVLDSPEGLQYEA